VFSYFSESVRKWRDLNLSATFTAFYHAAAPVSESLPQVVHHQETIVSLLEEYIARQDPLAMASLLEYFPPHSQSRGVNP
jgi:U3 small nucleolar RNA-associated protein 20